MKPIPNLLVAATLVAAAACDASLLAQQPGSKQHDHQPPGLEKTTKTQVLKAGAEELLRGEGPINAIHAHAWQQGLAFEISNGLPKLPVSK